MKKIKNTVRVIFALMSIVCVGTIILPAKVSAKDKTESLTGMLYEFGEKSKYEISDSTPSASGSSLGTLNVSGDFKTKGSGGSTEYDVSKGNLTITYDFDSSILSNSTEEWHICEDDIKVVDGINIEDKVKNGVIIVQTSLDKNKWVTDTVRTNAFTSQYNNSDAIYTTKDIQLVNGCYYRIIIAHEQEKITGSSQVLFVKTDKKEYKKFAEVYEFYAVNSAERELSDASATPRKELGEKIGVKKDTGYSKQETIDNKNPHYGWNIGTFSVNGYTRETSMNGDAMFLKNAGDKVTLWFKLTKDIDDLDGNGKYSIVEDKNGSDQYFEVKKTNFKRGALIIRFIDHEGVKHDPILYTDFLAANAMTGADTKAVLFEEGDYEVALDYTIGENGVFGSENDYRIFFKFSIRNGNTMFFPFDLKTGAELRDKAITPNGFTIDMAKSRYLNINVTRTAVVAGATGHTEDVRFNGPAKDGAQYKDEGIYTVDVVNQYTNEHTVKTFYVGSDPFMVAMAKSGKTMKELDEFVAQGYTIETDGSLVAPIEEKADNDDKDGAESEKTSAENDEVAQAESTKEETSASKEDEEPATEIASEETEETEKTKETEETEEIKRIQENGSEKSTGGTGIIVAICIVVVVAAMGLIAVKRKKGTTYSSEANEIHEEKGGEE